MQEVTALISNFLMEYSHSQSLFIPVTAPFLSLGEFPLFLDQSIFGFS